ENWLSGWGRRGPAPAWMRGGGTAVWQRVLAERDLGPPRGPRLSWQSNVNEPRAPGWIATRPERLLRCGPARRRARGSASGIHGARLSRERMAARRERSRAEGAGRR